MLDNLVAGGELHHYGLVVEFEGAADTGKTLAAVATVLELLKLGYSGDDVHSNIWLNIPGSHYYNNAGLRQYLRELFDKGIRHKILLFDEIDSVFPSRGFKDKIQTQDVLNLNQMTKTENWFLLTRHLGSSIDKIIRDCTNISVRPLYDQYRDIVDLEIINAVDCMDEVIQKEIFPASDVFPIYKRWEPTK